MVDRPPSPWPLQGQESLPPASLGSLSYGVTGSTVPARHTALIWTFDETEARLLSELPPPLLFLVLCGPWTAGCTFNAEAISAGSVTDLLMATNSCTLCPLPAGIHHEVKRPALICSRSSTLPAWMEAAWQRWIRSQVRLDSIAGMAMKAGLCCFHDDFTGCHQAAQSLEGRGQRHGDYWHAILHRREPDYGNSRYWFRQVGRHPIFEDLWKEAQHVVARQDHPHLRSWLPRLTAGGQWNPLAFIDCVAAAVESNDPAFRRGVEEIQYREMLLLLAQTCRDGLQPFSDAR